MPYTFRDQVPLNVPSLARSKRGWHWVYSTWISLFALSGAALGLSGFSLWWYARKIEPHWIDWHHCSLPIRGLPRPFDGYRIVQLSDLHLTEGRPLTPIRLARIVIRVNRLNPDLIAITGDFVSQLDALSREGIAQLGGLHARDGVYCVPGNHDYWSDAEELKSVTSDFGLRWLINSHTTIYRNSATLTIAGVDDPWEGRPDLDRALRGAPLNAPVVLLVHAPNFADVAVHYKQIVLQLSGHSHGGQVRIPGLGPLALPDQAWRYPIGLQHIKTKENNRGLWVYTNRGLGMAEIPFRFHCRPEVTILTLRTA